MEQLALGVIAPPTPRPGRHISRIQAAEAPGNVLCIFQTNVRHDNTLFLLTDTILTGKYLLIFPQPGGLVVRKLKTVSHHF